MDNETNRGKAAQAGTPVVGIKKATGSKKKGGLDKKKTGEKGEKKEDGKAEKNADQDKQPSGDKSKPKEKQGTAPENGEPDADDAGEITKCPAGHLIDTGTAAGHSTLALPSLDIAQVRAKEAIEEASTDAINLALNNAAAAASRDTAKIECSPCVPVVSISLEPPVQEKPFEARVDDDIPKKYKKTLENLKLDKLYTIFIVEVDWSVNIFCIPESDDTANSSVPGEDSGDSGSQPGGHNTVWINGKKYRMSCPHPFIKGNYVMKGFTIKESVDAPNLKGTEQEKQKAFDDLVKKILGEAGKTIREGVLAIIAGAIKKLPKCPKSCPDKGVSVTIGPHSISKILFEKSGPPQPVGTAGVGASYGVKDYNVHWCVERQCGK
jgi:hypothetical protein